MGVKFASRTGDTPPEGGKATPPAGGLDVKRLIALVVLAGLIGAIKLLPWWASLGLIVGTGMLAVTLGKRWIKNIFLGAFKAKSAVLAGASARMISIMPAEPPKPDFGEDDEDNEPFEVDWPHRWFHLDFEIQVAESTPTPMGFWDPSELSIVSEDAKPGDVLAEEDNEVGCVAGVEIFEHGAWRSLEEKVAGSQRIRLHVALKNGVDRFRLRYYFEILKNARG